MIKVSRKSQLAFQPSSRNTTFRPGCHPTHIISSTKLQKNYIPTTPNTFLMSGTKMAIRSTTPRMTTVAVMWLSQENGRPPRSSMITVLRACSTESSVRGLASDQCQRLRLLHTETRKPSRSLHGR